VDHGVRTKCQSGFYNELDYQGLFLSSTCVTALNFVAVGRRMGSLRLPGSHLLLMTFYSTPMSNNPVKFYKDVISSF